MANNAWGYYVQILETGHLNFGKYYTVSDGVGTTSVDLVSIGQWHHFAAVHTVSELRLYIDGQLTSTADSPSGAVFYHDDDRPEVGRLNCGNLSYFYFKGLIDELGIYGRALTDEEISEAFEAVSEGKTKPEPPVAAVLPANVTNWWRGDGNAVDSIDGLNSNSNGSFGPGMAGQAFSFHGGGKYVDFGDVTDLDFTNEDFSVEGWFRIPHLPSNPAACGPRYPIFHNRDWGCGTQILADGRVNFYKYYTISDGLSVTSPVPVSTGDWHHFSSVHTVAELRLYINGQLVDTADSPTGAVFYQPSDRPEIGRTNCGASFFHFKGLIDEVTVYRRALSDGEIESIHAAHYAGKVMPPP